MKAIEAVAFPPVIPVMIGAAGAIPVGVTDTIFDAILLPSAFMAIIFMEYVVSFDRLVVNTIGLAVVPDGRGVHMDQLVPPFDEYAYL